MKLYTLLSKIGFLKNRYVAKFLFVAFLGIHIPLIGLVFLVLYFESQLSPVNVLWITLVLTLIATGLTLIILKNLVAPVLIGSKALNDYKNNRTVPRLSLDYTDEAGVLLQNIQATIQLNQKLLAEKKKLLQLLTQDLRIQTEKTAATVTAIFNSTDMAERTKLAASALKSMNHQVSFVEAFGEIMLQETAMSTEMVKVRKVNFDAVINDVKRFYTTKLESKNIHLITNIHVAEVVLKVNSKLLDQAFHYLMDNALKQAPDGSKIEITIEKRQGVLLILVKDDGVGFKSDQAERIFTKFDSLDENEEYAPGIGLYLTRQIIDRFGGTIEAESGGINQGATITIALKLYRSF